jgi:hypothetical protein
MTNEARYYKADIQLRRVVQTVKKAGKHFVVVTDKDTVEADYVLCTLSVGALKSHGVRFDKSARSQLDPVLAGMTAAKMTKIFVPLRPEFFAERNIAPDTFVTIYEQRHAWLLHLRTDGKPLVTIFASGAMSDLVEESHYADIENQMLDLLDRIGEPDLSGANDRRLGVGTHRGEEDFDKAGAGGSQGGRSGIGAAVELNVLANDTIRTCWRPLTISAPEGKTDVPREPGHFRFLP